MKHITKLLFLAFCFMAVTSVSAQGTQKLGHLNSVELLSALPEWQAAESNLETFSKQLQTQYQNQLTEYQTKAQRLQEDQQKGIVTQVDLEQRSQELYTLQQTITQFEQTAQQQVGQKREELFNPIIERAQKAIEDVAAEQGFSYIFDLSIGGVVYSPPSDDVTAFVKGKLGL